MYRRLRKPNYTHVETLALLRQLEMHKHVLFGESTNHQRAEIWSMVAEAVNAMPNSNGRTVDELKHRWKDMSHRARNSARNIHYTHTKGEIHPIPPTPYFDLIMNILGEDTSSNIDRFMTVSNESLSSKSQASALFANSESESEPKVREEKPDADLINHILSMGGTTNIKSEIVEDHISHRTGPRNQECDSSANSNNSFSMGLDQTTDNAMDNLPSWAPFSISQEKARDLTPKASVCKQISNQGRQYSCFSLNNLPNKNSASSSKAGEEDETSPEMEESSQSSRRNSKPRPMRLDPDTQEVMEINDFDSDSETSEDEEDNEAQEMAAEEESTELEVEEESKAMPTGESPPPQPQRSPVKKPKMDLEAEADCYEPLSLSDLKRLYYIKKMKMIDQRTKCFKVLEEKLRWELAVLQQQADGSDPGPVLSSSLKTPLNSSFIKPSNFHNFTSEPMSDGQEEVCLKDHKSVLQKAEKRKKTKDIIINGSYVDNNNSINLETDTCNDHTKQKCEFFEAKKDMNEKDDEKESELDQRTKDDEDSDLPRKTRSAQKSSPTKFQGKKRKLSTDNSEGNATSS